MALLGLGYWALIGHELAHCAEQRESGLDLGHVPEPSRRELTLRWVSERPIAVALRDGRAVTFCWAAFETESLWDVAIETLEFRLLPLWVDIGGVRIGGPEPDDPPILEIERVFVEAELFGWRQPAVALRQVLVLASRSRLHCR